MFFGVEKKITKRDYKNLDDSRTPLRKPNSLVISTNQSIKLIKNQIHDV